MTIDRIFDWLPLVTLIVMMTERWVRALALRRSGVRVVFVGWRRPPREVLYDTLVVILHLFWIYLIVAEAIPLSLDWLPDWLAAKRFHALPLQLAGAALLLTAVVLYELALRRMGASWRMRIDRATPGPLVTTGLFAWTRNPIYTAFDFLFIGAFLIHGRLILLLFGVVLIVLVHGIILREERFLIDRFGDAYRDYCRSAGRYGSFAGRV